VIVIIGLIVAGVVGGQTLVQQAKTRGIISEVEQYKVAFNTFRLQYEAFPGDMTTATSYWSGTANGDGDGVVSEGWSTAEAENLRAWQHLSSANIIPGSYTGSGTVAIGTNVPGTIYDGTLVYSFYGNSIWSQYTRGNQIMLVAECCNGLESAVKVRDANNIDLKIDDGKPGIGKFIAYHHSESSDECISYHPNDGSFNKKTVTYKINSPTDTCSVHFAMDDYRFQ
jgi:hypothetical protein